VAVILNALRALGPEHLRSTGKALPHATVQRLKIEHRKLYPVLDRIRAMADRLDGLTPQVTRTELEVVDRILA
jgi:hypothetical protein